MKNTPHPPIIHNRGETARPNNSTQAVQFQNYKTTMSHYNYIVIFAEKTQQNW
jgi:hypothetical protein